MPDATPSRRQGLNMTLGRQDMALVYELRQEGVSWKLLSLHFGLSVYWLMRHIRRCRNEGLTWLQKP
jgi:hypothetical protein